MSRFIVLNRICHIYIKLYLYYNGKSICDVNYLDATCNLVDNFGRVVPGLINGEAEQEEGLGQVGAAT